MEDGYSFLRERDQLSGCATAVRKGKDTEYGGSTDGNQQAGQLRQGHHSSGDTERIGGKSKLWEKDPVDPGEFSEPMEYVLHREPRVPCPIIVGARLRYRVEVFPPRHRIRPTRC